MTVHLLFSQHKVCRVESQCLFASLCIVAFLTSHGDLYNTKHFLEALPIISFAEVHSCYITAQEVTQLHILYSAFMREKAHGRKAS